MFIVWVQPCQATPTSSCRDDSISCKLQLCTFLEKFHCTYCCALVVSAVWDLHVAGDVRPKQLQEKQKQVQSGQGHHGVDESK